MRIGIDMRAMQIGHQFRGIGEVLRNACRQIDHRNSSTDEIVVFIDPTGSSVEPIVADVFGSDRPRELIGLPHARRRSKWRRLFDSLSPQQSDLIRSSCDVFVQFDFLLGVPEGVPSVLVVHDQIPILLGDRYPHIYWPHYSVARRSGQPPRTAAARAARRWLYERNLARSLDRARWVLADSQHTAATTLDFARSRGPTALDERLSVALLGQGAARDAPLDLNAMEHARIVGLGLDRSPFVLYMGGVDDRRRIDLLVAAFNDLSARGVELELVLAGDSFASVAGIGVERTRVAIASSSYADHIHLLGFVSGAERAWLYGRAEAFAFPSEHEGFGLPVLEALAAGCPVVAFDNTSMPEVCGPNSELVAADWRSLGAGLERMLNRSAEHKEAAAAHGRAWASRFTWDTIGAALQERIDAVRPG